MPRSKGGCSGYGGKITFAANAQRESTGQVIDRTRRWCIRNNYQVIATSGRAGLLPIP
jgi:hypothetical protein